MGSIAKIEAKKNINDVLKKKHQNLDLHLEVDKFDYPTEDTLSDLYATVNTKKEDLREFQRIVRESGI